MECSHEKVRMSLEGSFRCNVCNEYISLEEAIERDIYVAICDIRVGINYGIIDNTNAENITLKHNIDSLLLEKSELINNLERVEAYMREIEINSDLLSKENEELKRTIKTLCKVLGE